MAPDSINFTKLWKGFALVIISFFFFLWCNIIQWGKRMPVICHAILTGKKLANSSDILLAKS